jgi:hypothetical protein
MGELDEEERSLRVGVAMLLGDREPVPTQGARCLTPTRRAIADRTPDADRAARGAGRGARALDPRGAPLQPGHRPR